MVHWGGLCCLGAAAFYLLSRRTGRVVAFLESVNRVDHLSDLESTVLPSIIAVSGRVGSETPIKSEHSGILGVIVQETTEQQFLKRNWKFSWVQDTALMLPTTKEVPWYLDDGTGRVNVAEAQTAIGFALTVGSEVFEKPEPSSLVRGTLDYLRGLKMLGIRRIERLLPIGTRLTVVGQAIKDGTGDVRIQKPEQGPFYVSPIPLDQLISKLGKWSRRFKKASIGLTFLGLILISRPVINYILVRTRDILERRRLRLLRKRVVDAAAKRKEQATEEDGDAPDLCTCCFEQKCDSVFVPCGHMCCCRTCSLKLQGSRKPCPLCREQVVDVLKIYGLCRDRKRRYTDAYERSKGRARTSRDGESSRRSEIGNREEAEPQHHKSSAIPPVPQQPHLMVSPTSDKSDSQTTVSDPNRAIQKAKQLNVSPPLVRNRPFRLSLQKKGESRDKGKAIDTGDYSDSMSSAKKSLTFRGNKEMPSIPATAKTSSIPATAENLSISIDLNGIKNKSWFEITQEEEEEEARRKLEENHTVENIDDGIFLTEEEIFRAQNQEEEFDQSEQI